MLATGLGKSLVVAAAILFGFSSPSPASSAMGTTIVHEGRSTTVHYPDGSIEIEVRSFSSAAEGAVDFLFMLFWIAMALACITQMVWRAAGKEVLRVTPVSISQNRTIFGISLDRSNYRVSDVATAFLAVTGRDEAGDVRRVALDMIGPDGSTRTTYITDRIDLETGERLVKAIRATAPSIDGR